MELSIIIPAHNEEANLEAFVSSFIHTLPSALPIKEILIVENGSTDGTLAAARRLEGSFPRLVHTLTIPRGSYGEAIKEGMLRSSATHLSILECDCLDLNFVADSVRIFQMGQARFIVASKRLQESLDERPLRRRILTMLYSRILLQICLGYPGTDTHGLKSMETRLAKQLCALAVTTDEVFQTEIVLLAWKMGVTICERPIQIREMRGTPVSILRRFPKVVNTVRELQRSLSRFNSPDTAPKETSATEQASEPVLLSRAAGAQ